MGPTKIDMLGVMPGEEYTHTLYIYNFFETEMYVSFKIDGECENWTNFYLYDNTKEITEVLLNPNSTQKISVKFDIPPSSPVGSYSCNIYAEQNKDNEDGQQIFIIALKTVTNFFVIGKEYVNATISGIEINNINETNGLPIIITYENNGNSYQTPHIQIQIKKDGQVIDTFSHNNESIRPGNIEEIRIFHINNWSSGPYSAEIDIQLNGSTIFESDLLYFEIYEKVASISIDQLYAPDVSIIAPEIVLHGELAKIELQIKNNCDCELYTKANGIVISENMYINFIETNTKSIKSGETSTIVAYFSPVEFGDYSILFNLSYNGENLPLEEINISYMSEMTNSNEPIGMLTLLHFPSILIIFSILACIVVIGILQIRKNKIK